jgi:hypothetical protein
MIYEKPPNGYRGGRGRADGKVCYIQEEMKMISITNGKWIADLGSMTCRNIENRMVVGFKRQGDFFSGAVEDMPLDLLATWARSPEGMESIRRAVEEAEEVFLRAWFEAQTENE